MWVSTLTVQKTLWSALYPATLTLGLYVAYWPEITFGLLPDSRMLYGAYALAPLLVGGLYGIWRGYATETLVGIGVVPSLWLVLANGTAVVGYPGIHLPDTFFGWLIGVLSFTVFGLLCSGFGLLTGTAMRRFSAHLPSGELHQ